MPALSQSYTIYNRNTSSSKITEVKQLGPRLALGWVNSRSVAVAVVKNTVNPQELRNGASNTCKNVFFCVNTKIVHPPDGYVIDGPGTELAIELLGPHGPQLVDVVGPEVQHIVPIGEPQY